MEQFSSGASDRVSSTISRDLTEGKKAKEAENLTALQKNTDWSRKIRFVTNANGKSESEDDVEIDYETEDDDDDESSQSVEEDATKPKDNLEGIKRPAHIPWRVDTLRRRAKEGDPKHPEQPLANNDATSKISVPFPTASETNHQQPSNSDQFSKKTQGSDGFSKTERDPATALARRASDQLGLNLLEDTEFSRFLTHLLDVMTKQGAHIDYLNSRIHQFEQQLDRPLGNHDPDTQHKQETNKLSGPEIAPYNVLHRINCNARFHKHGSGLYLDKPSRCGVELNGEYTLWDFTAYLMDNPDIVFIVFQNYSCDRVPNSRSKQNRFTKSRSGNIDPHQISPDYESIYLVSDTLRSTLIELGNCSVFEQDNLDEMIAPYLLVYHYRRQLLELAGKRQDVSRHISTLLSYIESHYKEEYDDADCKFAKGVVIPEHLTKLWIPNEVFLCNEKDHHMAYVLEKWPLRAAFDMGTTEDLELSCWLWAYNGNELYRTYTTKTISIGSHDEIRIDQLRAYPLKYSTRVSQNRLRDRGSKFWNLRRRHLIVYSGLDFYKDRTYDHNRFMIDVATYSRLHRGHDMKFIPGDRDRFDFWPKTITREQQQLSDAELTILPPSILGFDFQEKEWIRLNVDSVEDITWNKGAFNRLVLPSKTKELIQALVTARISGMQDIISNKGNGLVILLHGGPGTGKTLTAETVAEIAEKPLYRVTCGDIGKNAEEVENYLSSIFSLGKIWGCVLLLDEADVFLQERSLTDLHRNSIVSVFLRILEYYDGILILTSNRVGTFDAAFKSRIQVSLHYSNLSKSSRKRIWQNFLDMLEDLDEEVDIAELERHLDDLAEDRMNGRQIRNCVTTARGLAAFRKQKLGWNHFEQAIRTASEFQRYLDDVHNGLTEDEMAREDGLR